MEKGPFMANVKKKVTKGAFGWVLRAAWTKFGR